MIRFGRFIERTPFDWLKVQLTLKKVRAVRLWNRILIAGLLTFVVCLHGTVGFGAESATLAKLDPNNSRVPFCFLADGRRSWRVLTGPVSDGQRVELKLSQGEKIIAQETQINELGLAIQVSIGGRLEVTASRDATRDPLRLQLTLISEGRAPETQECVLRVAPPARPIGYVSDLVDDLIHTFYDAAAKRFQPISPGTFDQYFRRLQAHGVHRLIVWHSPFPFFTRPEDHDPVHWQQYAAQAKAIIESETLDRVLATHPSLPSWMWMKFVLALRLNPDAGPMFVRSAAEHGIALTASFEPFESALTKYYELPAFDVGGKFLWGFLPLATPLVNYRHDEVCFEHYRKIFDRMGLAEKGRLGVIELPGINNVDELISKYGPTGGFELHSSPIPPIASDSFVLLRQPSGDFRLVAARDIPNLAELNRQKLADFELTKGDDGTPQLGGINVNVGQRFLVLSHTNANELGPGLDRDVPVRLRSQAMNRLLRETIYWDIDESLPGGAESRIAGITSDGEYRAVFQACQNSITRLMNHAGAVSFAGRRVVIDLGADSSVEMLDFQQRAARQMAVNQLRTLLGYRSAGDPFAGQAQMKPVYDEIFINTRSHVDLATSYADGADGIQPIAHYYRTKRSYQNHLGMDKAYAPRSVAEEPHLIDLAKHDVERITTWQHGEWSGPCQNDDSPHVWRLRRNQAVGRGVTLLLQDLEAEFPGTRIRAVIPPRQTMVEQMKKDLEKLPAAGGSPYGREYYSRLAGTNNYIQAIGEGMALVDLHRTNVEPTFLGSGGYLPDMEPLRLYLDRQIEDMADNRGSQFRGPRSYFFEAQFTLRAADQKNARAHRERMILEMLSRKADIREVLLYEATDWLHTLPLDDPDYCSHAFTSR